MKNLPSGSNFYDFAEAYNTQNSDTIPDKHIERLFHIWIPRLAPDGDVVKAALAISQYAQNINIL